MRIKSLTVIAAVLLVATGVPAAASAATTLDVAVEQDDATGDVLVVVTDNGTAVENATVSVDGDAGYENETTYRTDANGTVSLAPPEDTQNVTVVATVGNDTAETTVLVQGDADLTMDVTQATDGSVSVGVERDGTGVENATVDVTTDGNYSDAGTYETDANGSLTLSAPAENVTVTLTATDENETVSETVDLTATTTEVEEQKNFGQSVKAFIDALRTAGFNGPPGRIISEFVVENNPGNAADAPGQSGDAPGNSGDAPGQAKQADDGNETVEAAGDDGEQGPPEHAKDKKNEKGDADAEDEDDDSEDAEADDEDDGGQGPPDHAKGNGNGKNKN